MDRHKDSPGFEKRLRAGRKEAVWALSRKTARWGAEPCPAAHWLCDPGKALDLSGPVPSSSARLRFFLRPDRDSSCSRGSLCSFLKTCLRLPRCPEPGRRGGTLLTTCCEALGVPLGRLGLLRPFEGSSWGLGERIGWLPRGSPWLGLPPGLESPPPLAPCSKHGDLSPSAVTLRAVGKGKDQPLTYLPCTHCTH